jgi:hypothetical protein
MPDAVVEEAAEQVLGLLSSIKEFLAAAIRSPDLFSSQLAKLASDQRDTIIRFSESFSKVLRGENYSSSSLRRSKSTLTRSSNDGSHSPRSSVHSPTSPSGGSSSSPASSPQPAGAAPSTLANCQRQYIEALTGVPDSPNDLESYPSPLQPGLIHGEPALMKNLFLQHPRVLDFLYDNLCRSSDTFEVFSEANMIWVGKYPLDFAASGKESARWHALSSTSGSGHRKKDLSTKMRHLLMLNLQLHFPPGEWVEILSIRDRLLNIFAGAIKAIPRSSSEVDDVMRRVELAAPALELLRIDSSPKEVAEAIVAKTSPIVAAMKRIEEQSNGGSFLSNIRISAESRQAKSVATMIGRTAADLEEELEKLRHHVEEQASPAAPVAPVSFDNPK